MKKILFFTLSLFLLLPTISYASFNKDLNKIYKPVKEYNNQIKTKSPLISSTIKDKYTEVNGCINNIDFTSLNSEQVFNVSFASMMLTIIEIQNKYDLTTALEKNQLSNKINKVKVNNKDAKTILKYTKQLLLYKVPSNINACQTLVEWKNDNYDTNSSAVSSVNKLMEESTKYDKISKDFNKIMKKYKVKKKISKDLESLTGVNIDEDKKEALISNTIKISLK